MSKRSARFSNPKNRRSKAEWEQAKDIHKAKLNHQKETMKSFGLSK